MAGEPELTLALPKGRLLSPAIEAFAEAGLDCRALATGRGLMCQDRTAGVRCLLVRPADVPTYVEQGVADLGVVGKDTLMEEWKDVCELLDLGYGDCRFVVAAPREWVAVRKERGSDGRFAWNSIFPVLRVATKYPRVTEGFFRSRGLEAEVIKVHGAAELAPLAGLAEVIVDLSSTGQTLRVNGLVEIEEIARISARLIANTVSLRLKAERVRAIVEGVRRWAENRRTAGREEGEGGGGERPERTEPGTGG